MTQQPATFERYVKATHERRIRSQNFGRKLLDPIAAVLALCLFLSGAKETHAQETQSDTLDVRVESIESSAIGRLKVLSAEKVVVEDESGKRTEFARNDVYAITFVKPLLDRPSSAPWIFLASGDFLKLTPESIDETTLTAKSSAFNRLPPFKVPLEFCRSISWLQSTDPIRQAIDFHFLLNRDADSDLLQLRNGDRIEGEFLEFSEGQVQIETSIGKSQLGVNGIRSLVFNPELVTKPKVASQFIAMTTTDGSTWRLRNVALDKETLKAESVSGFNFEIPLTALVELRFYSERFVPLSAMPKPTHSIEKYLSVTRKPQMNLNVLGGRMMVGRRPFATGIGNMGGTTVEWELPKNAKSFRTSAGLDRAARGKGSVRFEILVDGKSKWKSGRITGRMPLVTAPAIDLTGAKSLALKTHRDDFGHVLDYANWCNATVLISAN
jgi:hypothetical protein